MKQWGGHGEGAMAFSEDFKSACPVFISSEV